MRICTDPKAQDELFQLDRSLQLVFIRHIEKITCMPPRRHMRSGLPFFVENVTKQARLVYVREEETLTIMHCFATHKEYEKWYQSYV